MFIMKKNSVERHVATEAAKKKLEDLGYECIKNTEAETKAEAETEAKEEAENETETKVEAKASVTKKAK